MPTELSPHNPRIERVRELLSSRGRREQGRYAIEGATLIAEAQRSGLALRELYATEEALAERHDLRALEPAGLPTFTVTSRIFARLSDVETPTGLLAIVDLPASDPAAVLARPGPVLLLAGVNDPGNAGTLLRSAEAFGAAGALFGRGGVDPYAPKVVRAAMGSLFRLPVAQVDAEWLVDERNRPNRPIVAADMDGEELGRLALPRSAILAVGNERRGVRDWRPRFDLAVRIPQAGATESLNAAVAGSILLYELSRSR
ncbi:MAG: RNA methyltransferase [Candidatus Velthaea sp.]